jgi:hypothetical protein
VSPSCFHEAGAGDGGHEDGDIRAVLFVAIHVVTEAGAGDDLQVVRRTDGVAKLEVAVAGNAEVGFELSFGELVEAARAARNGFAGVHVGEEVFQEAHRTVSRSSRCCCAVVILREAWRPKDHLCRMGFFATLRMTNTLVAEGNSCRRCNGAIDGLGLANRLLDEI